MAMVSDEQVIKVLRQYNPWWKNPAAIRENSKPQKRLAYYDKLNGAFTKCDKTSMMIKCKTLIILIGHAII